MSDPEFMALKCSACGVPLQVAKEIEEFACGHCGVIHSVKNMGGTIYIQKAIEGISKVQAGTDRTADELALVRLKKDLEAIGKIMRIPYNEAVPKWERQLALRNSTRIVSETENKSGNRFLCFGLVIMGVSISNYLSLFYRYYIFGESFALSVFTFFGAIILIGLGATMKSEIDHLAPARKYGKNLELKRNSIIEQIKKIESSLASNQ